MMDDRFDDQLRRAAADYHRPPPTPREEMWRAIAAARAVRQARHVLVVRPWLRWGLAAAAVLTVGIALGRWTARRPQAVERAPEPVAYRVAATQYLSRAEALLTGFRADRRDGRAVDAEFLQSARALLTTTRLLLDSPAGQDPKLATLLEDLELVLMQIAQLQTGGPGGSGGRGGPDEEVDLINQGLRQRSLLPRLRAAIPAGPTAGTQGAL